MIRQNPMPDRQGNLISVGDYVLYLTVRHSEVVLNYAKVVKYIDKTKPEHTVKTYTLQVERYREERSWGTYTEKKVVNLTNPTIFKTGRCLMTPTDTIITGQ